MKKCYLIVLTCLCIVFLVFLPLIVGAESVNIAKFWFADDAFFYFKTASNIANGYGSTFDQANPTNGYHPLWMAILIPIFNLVGTSYAFGVKLVWAIVILLNATTGVLTYFILRKLRVSWVLASLAGLMIVLSPASRRVFYNGMESALYGAIFLCFVLFLIHFEKEIFSLKLSLRLCLLLGTILALLFLVRLDTVLLVPSLILVAGYNVLLRTRIRLRQFIWVVGAVALPILVLFLPYLAWNWANFGSIMPISGSVKALDAFAPQYFESARVWLLLSHFGSAFSDFTVLPLRFFSHFTNIPSPLWSVASSVGTALFLVVVLSAILRPRLYPSWVFPVLAPFLLVHMAYHTLVNGSAYAWYLVPETIFAILALAVLLNHAISFVYNMRAQKILLIMLVAVICAYCCYSYVDKVRQTLAPQGNLRDWCIDHRFLDRTVELIKVIPQDSKIGGRSVGMVAFFSERNIVDLSGLINGVDYYEYLKSNRVGEYVRKTGIRYLVINVCYIDDIPREPYGLAVESVVDVNKKFGIVDNIQKHGAGSHRMDNVYLVKLQRKSN